MVKVMLPKMALCLLFCTFSAYSTDVSVDEKTPLKWNLTDIQTSTIQHNQLSDISLSDDNKMNTFIIAKLGNNNVIVFNSASLEPIGHFKTRFSLHTLPKYSPDNRFAYLVFKNGWINKYDIDNMQIVSEVKAGIVTNNLALSNDGKYAIVGNELPHNVVILDTDNLSPIKLIETKNKKGVSSPVGDVYSAFSRYSFIVNLKELKEIWEIPYSDKGGVDVYKGWAHDYRKDGGEGKIENWKSEDKFPVRRIKTNYLLDNLILDPNSVDLIGFARNNLSSEVINLDTKKKITSIKHAKQFYLGSSIIWDHQGKEVFASSNIKKNKIVFFDTESWQVIKEVKIEGSQLTMRSHTESQYIWTKTVIKPNKDEINIITKNTLKVIKTLTMATTDYFEFSKNGKYVLLSMQGNENAITIFDAKTLKEVFKLNRFQ